MTNRTDVHTPSNIVPSDYDYVAVWSDKIEGIGSAEFMIHERKIVREHMERTGGTYACVDTTGSCQVCGNVQAIFLALFYHRPSNTYIRVGFDCAQKLEMSGDLEDFNSFRRNVQNAREAQAGKKKAIALLGDAGLSEAWDIYAVEYPKHDEGCTLIYEGSAQVAYSCTCTHGARVKEFDRYEERTIRDIVGKLVKYGSISDAQKGFISKLLAKIIDRPIVEAQRQAEKDAAGPAPTGRVKVTGTVVGMKEVERERYSRHDSGVDTKLIIKLENGSKIYGNRFANLEKGEEVTFTASIEASKNDPKFGFYKRAVIAARELTKEEKKAVAKLRRVVKTIPWSSAHQEWGTPACNTFYTSHQVLEQLISDIKEGK